MSSSTIVLLHVAGAIAISQLILREYHLDFYHNLNSNTTGIFQQTFDSFGEALSFILPAWDEESPIGLSTLLQAVVYLTAALYVFYLTRLVLKLIHNYTLKQLTSLADDCIGLKK